jgi:hypothetical protein
MKTTLFDSCTIEKDLLFRDSELSCIVTGFRVLVMSPRQEDPRGIEAHMVDTLADE